MTFAAATFGTTFDCRTPTFTWNFGDGSPLWTAPVATTTHRFNRPGTYNVSAVINTAFQTVTIVGTVVVAPSSVPTLSPWHLAALALTLALVGVGVKT